jgi:D-alanyl-D-alanine carboxypeptidase (penicillin-binding protein 5/6)
MTNTQFKNPNGLHNDEHYTTATDMAILTREALKNEKFAEIVSTLKYQIPPTNKTSETRYFINTNRLIHADMDEPFYYEYATGVKTGYTMKAGQTLVASAAKDNTSLIAVVLDDTKDGKWTDCKKLFEYGFAKYVSFNILDLVKQIEISIDIPNAAPDDPFAGSLILTPEAKGSEYITSTKEMAAELSSSADNIEVNYLTDLSILRAPLEQGVAVGEVQYLVDGQVVMEARLLTSRAIAENTESVTITPSPSPNGSEGKASVSPVIKFILTFLIVLASLVALLFILRFFVRFSNKRRRSRRRRTQYRTPYRFK